MQLLGALAAGLIYSFLTPIFIPFLLFSSLSLYLLRSGYQWPYARMAVWHFIDILGGRGTIFLIGLLAVAAISAGFVAARITRDIPYTTCTLLVTINVTICAYIARDMQELYRVALLLAGCACVFFGGYMSDQGLRQIFGLCQRITRRGQQP